MLDQVLEDQAKITCLNFLSSCRRESIPIYISKAIAWNPKTIKVVANNHLNENPRAGAIRAVSEIHLVKHSLVLADFSEEGSKVVLIIKF